MGSRWSRERFMEALMIEANLLRTLEEKVAIEEAQFDDLPAIIAIDSDLTGIPKPEIWYGYYAPVMTGAQRTFMVARHEGAVVGYVVGEVRAWEFGSPPCGWLFAIGVRKDVRLAGIGTLLFNALQARFRRLGVQTMRTMLHIDDHLLISFFRSHGMTAGPFIELEMGIAPVPSDT